ncbi:hypothetical protein QBC37DRAFT_379710 [Rhypophila decipiens]|uniref:Uncharacterized protein n=1 Tax=Rhypophila decipiens TaxID=261697 RepID=A0AAN7B2S2_9PEZI|nr:hypothetical protein QBC37DRAFT_379710 [Rhypophila decipiens]
MSTQKNTGVKPKDRDSFKLQGNNNFLEWRAALRSSLATRDLLRYITENVPPRPGPIFNTRRSIPEDEPRDEALSKWRCDRAKCYQVILNSLSKNVVKTLLNNEPEAFSGSGSMGFTPVERDRYDMTWDTAAPEPEGEEDHQTILDGPDPKDLYDLICECYPYINPALIKNAVSEMREAISGPLGYPGHWSEYSVHEGLARLRFLWRSLQELGLGQPDEAWNEALKRHLVNESKNICRYGEDSDMNILMHEILVCKREKRWSGE